MKKAYFWLPLILLAAFLVFRSTLSYFFISDDFFYTSFKSFSEVISINKGEYHYNPVFWLVLWGIKQIFGLNPFVFHLFTVIIHLINVCLVYFLSQKLTGNKVNSLITAFLFSVFFASYEVVFWITGISTSLMVVFYLLDLLSFLAYTKKKQIIKYFFFVVFFLLAMLAHEYAISLPVILLIYWYLYSKKKTLKDLFLIGSLPVLIIIILTFLKINYANASLIVGLPTLSRFFASIIKSFLYLFLPIPQLIDRFPKILLPFLFLILIIIILKNCLKNKLHLFLLLWVLTTIIIFSATSLPQARYFYLSAIPAILLIVSLVLVKQKLKISGAIYLVIILISQILFIQQQKIYWEQSSQITRQVLADIQKAYPKPNFDKPLYFLNLPDSINGPPWNAYIFRRGFNEALENVYKKKLTVVYFRTVTLDEKVREDKFLEKDDLEKLINNKETIFLYNPQITTVVLLK